MFDQVKIRNRILFLVLAAVLLLIISGCARQEAGFSCYVLDSQRERIEGIWSEVENCWYLYLPADLPLSDLTLYYHYGAPITSSSGGKLHTMLETVEGAFGTGGDTLTLRAGDETEIRVCALQSGLPSIQLYLARTTLQIIQKDKDVKYPYNTLILSDPGGAYSMAAEGRVTIKGRGNSTWDLHEKKGYQLEFSVDTSVLGMPEGKKWILLANAFDDSLMRTKLVYDAAAQMDMAFVPEYQYADLWIDNVYQGTYLIGEKVELAENRLELSDPRGVLMEHDEGFYMQEQYWFRSDTLKRHFALKDTVSKDPGDFSQGMKAFESSLDELMRYLYATPSSRVTLEDLGQRIDVDSFAKYYLINEYVLNREAFVSSFYWYQDGPEDVIHLGPVWDFDTCMGNDGAGFGERYGDNHTIFTYLLAAPAFASRTQELLDAYSSLFSAMQSEADRLESLLSASARMNYLRWDDLGKPNGKYPVSIFADTYPGAVELMKQWLAGREEFFTLPRIRVVNSEVDENFTMKITLEGAGDCTGVQFALWSEAEGKDDLQWYTAEKTDEGFTCRVDLRSHTPAGFYWIHAYSVPENEMLAWGCNYALAEGEDFYRLDTEVTGNIMTISLEDGGLCGEALAAVWSDRAGQDDIVWYTLRREEDGVLRIQVDLSAHPGDGKYHIHAYEDVPGKDRFLKAGILTIEEN